MHRIDTSTAQKDKFGAGKNGFTLGNAQTGVPPTEVSADILDALQEEVCAVIEDPDSGIILDKKNNSQLAAAIKALIYKKTKDIGLTKYGAPMIGVPIDWPLAQMPQDIWPDCGMVFLSCAGQGFNKTTYPLAAQLYPSGVMPEIRGEFVRAWDNGRGVDAGRTLLSAQTDAFQNFTGTILSRPDAAAAGAITSASGAFSYSAKMGAAGASAISTSASATNLDVTSLDPSRVARTANETRPRSIAFHKTMRVA